jgi:hypothetical protein
MNARRVTIIATAGGVAVLAVVLMVSHWDEANKIAIVASALATVAAVGVGILAALPGTPEGRTARASRTGRASAGARGRANTGVSGPSAALPGDVRAGRTGDADAGDGGDANTGISAN